MTEEENNLQELRDKARQLQDSHETVENLLFDLQRETYRLGDDWNNPAAAEMQSIVASLMRQVRDASGSLANLAQQMHMRADQVEQRRREERTQQEEVTQEEAPQEANEE